jgi:2-dehydropantoate 2-reductase
MTTRPGDDAAGEITVRYWASARAAAGVETDFLNGEVALLGRLHGVPTPANARIQGLMADAAARRLAPGSMSPTELLAALRA